MSRRPEKTAAARADLETISCRWFGDKNAAPAIESVVREVAAYQAGTGQQLSPSARRRKLEALQSAAWKLQHHLADLDTGTKLTLFGRMPEPSSARSPLSGPILAEPHDTITDSPSLDTPPLASLVGPATTIRAADHLTAFFGLLEALSQSTEALIKEIPPQAPGAPCAQTSAEGQTPPPPPAPEAAVNETILALARLLGRQAARQSMALPSHTCDAGHDG